MRTGSESTQWRRGIIIGDGSNEGFDEPKKKEKTKKRNPSPVLMERLSNETKRSFENNFFFFRNNFHSIDQSKRYNNNNCHL